MNKRFLTLAGVATVLSVGTYVGLNIVKPYKHEEPKVADVTSPDQVFGASVDNPEAHASDAAAAPAAAGTAPAEAAATQPADTSVQPASTSEAGATPAPAATAAAGDGSVAPLVPAGAAPAAAPTETAAAAPAPEPAPAPAPAAEPAPAPEPAAEAPAPAPKPKKAVHASSGAKKSSGSGSSAKVWWPAEQANKLSLVYAGPASFKKAVVLMFNGAFFKPDGIDANIKVTDKAGKVVAGSWEIGENNRRMLVFPVSDAGTYKVSIATGLTDSKGHKPGKALSGPVVVK